MNTITHLNRLFASASARMPGLYVAARITAALAMALFLVACDKPHH
ncbi:MAG: hypothetical protein WC718_14050 [Phycisphaerales bacterium]|jgi:hypothetical protein